MIFTALLALASLALGAWAVWGYVVVRFADMGIKHPEHQDFLVRLARSKRIDIPDLTLRGSPKSLEVRKRKDRHNVDTSK